MKIVNNMRILGRIYIIFLWVIIVLLFMSCSQVRFVPEDKYLLKEVELNVDKEELNKVQAASYIRQRENYKILGFLKFHLMLYNMSSKKKDKGWLKRIGEAPVIYDDILTDRSENQLKQYAYSKGFYEAKIESRVELEKKRKKAKVIYDLETGPRYTVRKINYHVENDVLDTLFRTDEISEMIMPGDPFDMDVLEQLQKSMVELFRNNGYYYFTNDYIRFEGDSISYGRQIILDLFVGDNIENEEDSIRLNRKYYLNHFYISVLPGNTAVTSVRDTFVAFTDTINWENNTLYQSKKVQYPTSLFDRTINLEQGDLFNGNEVESAFRSLTRLRQFRFVDINFQAPENSQDSNMLDCMIRLAPLSKQSTSFDIEGTNTSGNFGVAGNITYQHRNIFRAAEVFSLKLKGATENLQYLEDGYSQSFNTRELGVEGNLAIPRLLGPGNFIRSFSRLQPKTVLNGGFNYQKRPEYTRTISNLKFGYDWKTREEVRQMWNLLDINMVNIFEYDPDFIEDIDDLYIKSSFTDHLIMAMNYAVLFNNQLLAIRKNYTYVRLGVESAGNLLWVLSELTNREKHQVIDTLGILDGEYYKILDTRFAQYVKADLEIRHGHIFDEYNALVGRFFLGTGLPYGNFDVLPFEKKYFTGGANGIRAWQVRSLGPGSYKAPEDAYPNQSSDIKIEANVEYRFKFTNFLEGALFLDAGNIWAINQKDNRTGAQFKFNEFYKQIALGTGTGLRLDLKYFLFRLDLGLKLRDPAKTEGGKWIIGTRPFTKEDLNLSFAIGYPF